MSSADMGVKHFQVTSNLFHQCKPRPFIITEVCALYKETQTGPAAILASLMFGPTADQHKVTPRLKGSFVQSAKNPVAFSLTHMPGLNPPI